MAGQLICENLRNLRITKKNIRRLRRLKIRNNFCGMVLLIFISPELILSGFHLFIIGKNKHNFLLKPFVKTYFHGGLESLKKLKNKENYKMINLTDPAKTQIDDYFQGKAPTPIRIFLNSGG
jgi:hypothetical protein